MFTKKKVWLALLTLIALGGIAYWQHRTVLAHYYVRQLAGAYGDHREEWAKKAASVDDAAVPLVLDNLASSDPIVCGNMSAALFHVAKNAGFSHLRTVELAEQVKGRFAGFSTPGQEKTLLAWTRIMQDHQKARGQDGGAEEQDRNAKPLPAPLTKVISSILIESEKQNELRGASLLLAAELVDCVQPGQWVDACRAMAERGLGDPLPGTRAAAIQLLLRQPMRGDKELLAKVVPLLRDKAAPVRRAALLALAAEADVARDESLLPFLHDDDPEMQEICQMAMRKRGLTDDDLRLARMISDPSPATRVRVVLHFHRLPDLNLSAWLRQLSHDASPLVRAAAVRAAGDYPHVDLAERLRELASTDPDETVRLNAQHYLAARAAPALPER
jgi:hypothetical protein